MASYAGAYQPPAAALAFRKKKMKPLFVVNMLLNSPELKNIHVVIFKKKFYNKSPLFCNWTLIEWRLGSLNMKATEEEQTPL